jgi:hypothetical protein
MSGPKDRPQPDARTKRDALSIEDSNGMRARLLREKGGSGYDPYKGELPRKPKGYKKDLRELNAWVEAKRRAEAVQREQLGATGVRPTARVTFVLFRPFAELVAGAGRRLIDIVRRRMRRLR